MTDCRVPERWLNDRRVLRLSDGAFRLFITALTWAVSNRTDGAVDTTDLSLMPGVDPSYAKELVAAGLWKDTAKGGWLIVDFAATQTSAKELGRLEKLQRQDRERKARNRAAKRDESAAGAPDGHADIPADSPPDGHRDSPTGRTRQARQAGQAGRDGGSTTSGGNRASRQPDATVNGAHLDERAEVLAARGWDD